MGTPIILLTGLAGSGKDTVAGILAKYYNACPVAQADPLKRLAKNILGFSESQLWGPSSERNATDPRWDKNEASRFFIFKAKDKLRDSAKAWVSDVFPDDDTERQQSRIRNLRNWFEYHVQAPCGYGQVPLSPRLVLQTLGTEFGRTQDPDLWSKYAIRVAIKLLGGGYGYDRQEGLISDVNSIPPAFVVLTDGRFRNEVLNIKTIGGAVVRIDAVREMTALTGMAASHSSEAEQKTIPSFWFTHILNNDHSLGVGSLLGEVAIFMKDAFSVAGKA